MKILHGKSACCQAHIRRFGGKRRQCVGCLRTWRVRPARRGPKPKRPAKELLGNYASNVIGSWSAVAKASHYTTDALERRANKARDYELDGLVQGNCMEPHILLADALTERIVGYEYTTYLILTRPLASSIATVCYVATRQGHESGFAWRQAFASLPDGMTGYTEALVCDGHPGIVRIAKLYGWTLQRCCFHLFKELNKNMRLWHRATGEVYWVHELFHTAVETMDDQKAARAVALLENYAKHTDRKQVASIIRGLSKQLCDYRRYIYRPDLHLPATNNSCEASFRRVRSLQAKARGWKTPSSHEKWIEYVLLANPTIACNEGQPKT